MSDHEVMQFDAKTGEWSKAIPAPFYYGLLPWLWLRFTGYRDHYGRKAQFIGWRG